MSIPTSENMAPAAQDTAAHASMIEKVKNFVHSLGLAGMNSRLHDHAAETPHEDMKYYFGPSAAGSTATLPGTMTPSDTTGSTTPSSIRSAPERLQMRIPPPNYGAVVPGSIYRSSYPDPTNHEFLRDLKIKSILTLVPEPIAPEYRSFMDEAGIQHFQVHISANKGAVMVDSCAMSRALRLLMDRTNHPILVHCNKGKHRTGCTIACFRRITGLGMEAVRDEYHTYAGKKARLFDEVFFENFDLNLVMWMAREQGWASTVAAPLSPPATPPTSSTKPVDIDANVDVDALEAVDTDARKATDATPRDAMDAMDALKFLAIPA